MTPTRAADVQGPGRRFGTVRNAAEWLGIHEQTCYRWFYAGRIPGVRIGRTVRIDLRLLEAQLARGMRPAAK
jgi:excisionase family DNA binding protein